MNERQAYALAHPLNAASGVEAERTKADCTATSRHRSGFLVLTILAVDR